MLTISNSCYAHIAQLVEHVLGKNGVISSNLIVGFVIITEEGIFQGWPA